MARENGAQPRSRVGALIKRYREDMQMTQSELAEATGISLGALRDLEQGRTASPRWGTAEGLAAVLRLDEAQRAELARACRRKDAARVSSAVRPPRGVRIAILGPLAAWRDGVRLALGPARQRAVLGLLALHVGAAMHRDEIIDVLWGERPPASAVAEVQGYVSRLRKLLGGRPGHDGGPELVGTVGGRCYELNAGVGALDLATFGDLTRQAAAEPDPARACGCYEQALALWRAGILVDVGLLCDHPAAVEATRRRAEAVLGYADAAARAGTHARVLPHLRDLCAREPLHEQAHAWLMTALAATGQQAAALEVFTTLRHRLDAELGIAPSPLLAQAHAQVLRQQIRPSRVT
jgi:DNA-binding SARP family transcriptional activator/DNA-binding XRE family transcriptional regulator